MKKTLYLLSICLLVSLFSCTKPSGVEVTQHFSVSNNYHRLYLCDGMEVTVTESVDDIVITADENVMQKIKVECKNGSLRIYRSDFSLFRLLKAKVRIPYNPGLHELDVNSYSSFISGYGLEGEDIKVTVSDFSDVDVDYILANNLKLKLDDNADFEGDMTVLDLMDLYIHRSDVDLTGDAAAVHLNMSENSEIVKRWDNGGYAFSCDYCYGTMTGKCKAYFHCYDRIAVDLTNNSFLYCTGEPNIDESTWDDTSCITFD